MFRTTFSVSACAAAALADSILCVFALFVMAVCWPASALAARSARVAISQVCVGWTVCDIEPGQMDAGRGRNGVVLRFLLTDGQERIVSLRTDGGSVYDDAVAALINHESRSGSAKVGPACGC
jgi:hypothetical protein